MFVVIRDNCDVGTLLIVSRILKCPQKTYFTALNQICLIYFLTSAPWIIQSELLKYSLSVLWRLCMEWHVLLMYQFLPIRIKLVENLIWLNDKLLTKHGFNTYIYTYEICLRHVYTEGEVNHPGESFPIQIYNQNYIKMFFYPVLMSHAQGYVSVQHAHCPYHGDGSSIDTCTLTEWRAIDEVCQFLTLNPVLFLCIKIQVACLTHNSGWEWTNFAVIDMGGSVSWSCVFPGLTNDCQLCT